MIREAVADDAPAIAAILNRAIADTTISFRTTPVTAQDRAGWIAARQAAGFAVLVAEVPESVGGFAAYGPFREGEGYALTVEHTVHVAEDFRGRDIGRALMTPLIARARAAGFHAMVGAITGGNEASCAFHARLGFRRVGTMPQVGHKFGRWLDLDLWQLLLDERDEP